MSNGKTVFWPYAEASRRVRRKDHGLRLRLERHSTGVREVVVIEDSTAFNQIQNYYPAFGATPVAARLFKPLLYLAVLGAALPLLYWFALPAALEKATELAPIELEEQLGQRMVAAMAPPATVCGNEDLYNLVDEVMRRLVIAAHSGRYVQHLTISDDLRIYAGAFPGGHVLLTRGLVARTDSLEELAGVLAPEIHQLAAGHTRRIVFSKLALPGLMAITVGAGKSDLAKRAAEIGVPVYTASEVIEGEAEGFRLLQEAKIDPTGMISWFGKLEAKPDWRDASKLYSSSHPGLKGAVQRLRDLAIQTKTTAIPIRGSANWENVKYVCDAKKQP